MIKVTSKCLSLKRRALWVVVCTMATVTMVEYFIRNYSASPHAQFVYKQYGETITSESNTDADVAAGTFDKSKDTKRIKPLLKANTKRSKKSGIDKDVYDIMNMVSVFYAPVCCYYFIRVQEYGYLSIIIILLQSITLVVFIAMTILRSQKNFSGDFFENRSENKVVLILKWSLSEVLL